MKNLNKVDIKIKTVLGSICKWIYYVFIIWVFIIGIAGTYNVLRNDRESNDVLKERLYVLEKADLYDMELRNFHKQFNHRYNITLYTVRKEMPYSSQKVTILSKVGGIRDERIKAFWQDEPTYKGYQVLNELIIEKGTVYIENIKGEPSIFNGETAIDITKSNVNSLYSFIVLKNDGGLTYILALASTEDIDIDTVDFYLSTRQVAKDIRRIINE